jgi:hypothetical protein
MLRLLLSILFIFSLNAISLGQRPFEIGGMAGGAFYNGDLGNFFQAGIGPGAGISATYNFTVPFGVRANLNLGMVNGKDKVHPESKLAFRSYIFDYSVQLHYYITRLKSKTRNYSIKYGRRSYRSGNFSVISYVFVGLGGFSFNPKGQYKDGSWHELQPLTTEGQGIIPTRDPYNLFSMNIPFGAGIRYPIKKGFYLGFELSFRKTFTDYLDDVSLTYLNTQRLETQVGPESAYFSDPSENISLKETYPAIARGNPKNKDAYLFSFVSLSYDFPKVKKRTKFKI